MKRLKATFTIYREGAMRVIPGNGRGWRWRLTAANGNIIADGGEAYSSKSKALRAVRRLLRLVRDFDTANWRDNLRALYGIDVVVKD